MLIYYAYIYDLLIDQVYYKNYSLRYNLKLKEHDDRVIYMHWTTKRQPDINPRYP